MCTKPIYISKESVFEDITSYSLSSKTEVLEWFCAPINIVLGFISGIFFLKNPYQKLLNTGVKNEFMKWDWCHYLLP